MNLLSAVILEKRTECSELFTLVFLPVCDKKLSLLFFGMNFLFFSVETTNISWLNKTLLLNGGVLLKVQSQTALYGTQRHLVISGYTNYYLNPWEFQLIAPNPYSNPFYST